MPSQVMSNLLLLPSQHGNTNVLLDGHRYNLLRQGKVYDQWRCAQYSKNVIELLDAVGVGAFDVYLMQTLGKKRKRDNDSQQNQE